MTSALTKARVYANAGKQYLIREYRSSDVEATDPGVLDDILSRYTDDDVVFVHAGLSDVKAAFGGNPYELLLAKLAAHFDSVLAPGFTPAFRQSGVYHKVYSRPEFGAFSRLFLDEADYRTDDAIHSILVKGDYRFDECDHHDSFASDGCWAKLDEDNVLYLNVGTGWPVCTQFHFIERSYDVPYHDVERYEGHMYHDDVDHEPVTQTNFGSELTVLFNRRKIQRLLAAQAVSDEYDIGGLDVRFFRARDTRLALADKLAGNPYYLVT